MLSPAADKWEAIGLAMGIAQNALDDIAPGNSTDWLRLREVCGLFMHYPHTWEDVAAILITVGEQAIAHKLCEQEKLEGVSLNTLTSDHNNL